MLDPVEGEETPEETISASEAPVEEVSEEAISETVSLEDLAKQYDMTPEQVIASYGEAQKKITEQGQSLGETKRQYEWADQFQHELYNRPGLREHIESFFSEGSEQQPKAVSDAIDPNTQRIASLEAKLYSQDMNAALDQIGADYPMNDDIRARVFDEVYKTNNADVSAIYWKQMGPEIAKGAKADGAKETAEEIQKNNESYTPPSSGGGPKGSPTVKEMTKEEWSDSLDNDLESMYKSNT